MRRSPILSIVVGIIGAEALGGFGYGWLHRQYAVGIAQGAAWRAIVVVAAFGAIAGWVTWLVSRAGKAR